MLRGESGWLWALCLLALTSPFWDLGHPLIEVDDARYAEVPREMAESGDWVTPRLDYMDYVEKPPLWYWAASASYKVFGVSEAAARLPLALLAVLGLAGTAWLGSWLFSLQTGLIAAIALSSCALHFFHSHYITLDLPLTVFLLWSCALILRSLLRPHDARWAAPAAWLAAALAFLSKGLVGLVFPAAWTVGLLLLEPRLRAAGRSLLSPAGPAIFLAVAAPWFVVMERRHPGFLHFFFTEQHFQRYLTAKYHRGAPWYFFLAVLPGALLPWTPAAAAGAAEAVRARRSDAGGAALLLWAALVVAFFSASQSKLISYVLPVSPQLCLLAARGLERPPRWAKGFSAGLGAVFALLPMTLLAAPQLGHGLDPLTVRLACSASLALGLALLGVGLWRPLAQGPRAAAALGLCGLLVGGLSLAALRSEGERVSAKALAETIKERGGPDDLIYAYGTYLHGIPFYTGRRVDKVLNWIGELHYAMRDPANAERFGGDEQILKLPLPDRRVFLAFRLFETPYVLSMTKADKLSLYRSFGRWALAEL